jgi:hypothetical protein
VAWDAQTARALYGGFIFFRRNLNKHRKILGTLFFALSGCILLAVSTTLIYNFFLGYLGNVIWNVVFVPISIALTLSGYCLLKSKEQAYPYIIWVAVVNLIIVPIGTLVSIYYVWFHYTYVKNKVLQDVKN